MIVIIIAIDGNDDKGINNDINVVIITIVTIFIIIIIDFKIPMTMMIIVRRMMIMWQKIIISL